MNSWIVFNKDWCPSISTTVLVYLVECPGLNPDMEMLVIENFWSKLFKLLNEWKHYVPESWILEKENELCCWSTLHYNSDNFLLLNVSKKKKQAYNSSHKGDGHKTDKSEVLTKLESTGIFFICNIYCMRKYFHIYQFIHRLFSKCFP